MDRLEEVSTLRFSAINVVIWGTLRLSAHKLREVPDCKIALWKRPKKENWAQVQ